MELCEQKNIYRIEGVFPDNIICGFTKKNISGLDPQKDFESIKEDDVKSAECAYMRQVHSSHVCKTEEPGVFTSDALFSAKPGLMLMVRTADCLPLLVYDHASDSVGVVHMGWRPAHNGILNNLGIDLSAATVAAGVGLRKCCYEVGGEFRHYNTINPFLQSRQRRLFFDPIAFAKYHLVKQGLRFGKLCDTGVCSYCNEKFPSFRREHTDQRTLSFIIKT